MVLTLEERGAYQTLLDLIYDRGGPMPDNDGLLARYMGVSIRKWKSLRRSLIDHGKIRIDENGNLVNDRAISEVENAAKTARKNSENATKTKRKSREIEKNHNENNESCKNSLPYARALPDTRSQKPDNTEEDKSSSGQQADFAFTGTTIRLNRRDLNKWVEAYHALPDLRAELNALDDWLQGPGAGKRGNWFHVVSGALSRKHQEILKSNKEGAGAKPDAFWG